MVLPQIEPAIDQLLSVLDDEVRLLELKQSQLEDLSTALLEHDDEAIEALLEGFEQSAQAQASVDSRLRALRETLADALGCGAKELKLSRLITELPLEQARAVDGRRRQIIDCVARFRSQHMHTTLLLVESSRITGMLLDGMLQTGDAVVTYGADGPDRWRSEIGLLNTEL